MEGGDVVNIVVVIKQTPDTETVIRIAPDNKQIVTSDIKWIINPYDEFAIEAALRLKEKHGGTVTVISYGAQRVVESLRTALAMGADDAVLIDDQEMKRADFLQVTEALGRRGQAKESRYYSDRISCGGLRPGTKGCDSRRKARMATPGARGQP